MLKKCKQKSNPLFFNHSPRFRFDSKTPKEVRKDKEKWNKEEKRRSRKRFKALATPVKKKDCAHFVSKPNFRGSHFSKFRARIFKIPFAAEDQSRSKGGRGDFCIGSRGGG